MEGNLIMVDGLYLMEDTSDDLPVPVCLVLHSLVFSFVILLQGMVLECSIPWPLI